MVFRLFLSCIALAFFLSSCDFKKEEEIEDVKLEALTFSDLPNWGKDQTEAALRAFVNSCKRIIHRPDEQNFFKYQDWAGKYKDWKPLCENILNREFENIDASAFWENHFTPYRVLSNKDGLFTGYYEPSLNGSYLRHGAYQTPLFKRPEDLVMVDLGDFRESLRGQRIAGRVEGSRLKPYDSRSDIVGQWDGVTQGDVLVWVDDPADAFFLQIQGSGRIILDTGEDIRVGYDGQNGHPYFAIGRALIDKGEIAKEDMSLQAIREWLADHPDQAESLMNLNPSYVFFRKLDRNGVLGGEGVVLTPERSLAVDTKHYPYGLPLWVDIEHPDQGQENIQRLMIAQDTGGAIQGVMRGDFFWGGGKQAEIRAGAMKSKGRFYVLLPKSVYFNRN